MKKKTSLRLFIGLLLLLCIPMGVQAAAGSKATGAKLPEYSQVVERVVTPKDDFDEVFGEYLKEAKANASRKTQYKIVIEPGKYSVNKTIHLPQTDFPMRAGLPKRPKEPCYISAVARISFGLNRRTILPMKISL